MLAVAFKDHTGFFERATNCSEIGRCRFVVFAFEIPDG
jgi:hypothetical protein